MAATDRSPALQAFVDAAAKAFADHASDAPSRECVEAAFGALQAPGPRAIGAGVRLPVVAHLRAALEAAADRAALADLIAALRAIEPELSWRRRSTNETASANFPEAHANAMIVGPGGIEERQDVWLGLTLMAPDTRYPDHSHAPEEVYLVLSESEFRQGEGDWFSPGIGGSFHNAPGIGHAMRSLSRPLLAFWVLRAPVAAEDEAVGSPA